jgi:hypothetical protein
MAVSTASIKKRKAKAPEATKPRKPAPKEEPETSPEKTPCWIGSPIETDKILVTFDGLKVTYYLKTTKETIVKEYAKDHALRIIHGRILSDPHGPYTQQCVAKARIAMMKKIPLS